MGPHGGVKTLSLSREFGSYNCILDSRLVRMELIHIPAVAVSLGFAAVVQGAAGFGFILCATPLILLTGIPLPVVIIMVATCSTMQAALGTRKLGKAVPWRLSLTATGSRLLSVIVGLWLLKQLVNLDTDYVRLVVGTIVCLLVIVRLLWNPQPVDKTRWDWALVAFSVSGLLAGLFGMGGVPLALWSLMHNWSTEKTRGFLLGVLVTSIPVQIAFMGVTFGFEILWNIFIGIAFLPIIYLGSRVGLSLGNGMSRRRFRLMVDLMLLGIGGSTVVGPVLRYFQ